MAMVSQLFTFKAGVPLAQSLQLLCDKSFLCLRDYEVEIVVIRNYPMISIRANHSSTAENERNSVLVEDIFHNFQASTNSADGFVSDEVRCVTSNKLLEFRCIGLLWNEVLSARKADDADRNGRVWLYKETFST